MGVQSNYAHMLHVGVPYCQIMSIFIAHQGESLRLSLFFLHHFSLELRAALSFVESFLVLFFIANASLEEPNIFPRKEFLGQQNDAGLKEGGTTTLNPALSSSST